MIGAESAESQLQRTWGNPGNIVKVAKSGHGYRSIQAALNSITDASEENPYLVSVAPGVYEEQVTLKPHIDIQGSGRGMTRINSGEFSTLTTDGPGPNEVRSLTIECATWDGCVHRPESLTLADVTIRASGSEAAAIVTCCGDLIVKETEIELLPTSQGSGTCLGAGLIPYDARECDWSCPSETRLLLDRISISGVSNECQLVGAWSAHRRTTVTNSVVSVDSTLHAVGITVGGFSLAELSNSRVSGTTYSLSLTQSYADIRYSQIHGDLGGFYEVHYSLAHSEFNGQTEYPIGPWRCFSVHDAYLNPLDEYCQPIP